MTETYSIEELHNMMGVETHLIIEFVEYGVLRPMDIHEETWHFPATQMQKLQRALRLQRDLELNIAGVALAIDLLDELALTRSKIKQLQHELSLLHIDYK